MAERLTCATCGHQTEIPEPDQPIVFLCLHCKTRILNLAAVSKRKPIRLAAVFGTLLMLISAPAVTVGTFLFLFGYAFTHMRAKENSTMWLMTLDWFVGWLGLLGAGIFLLHVAGTELPKRMGKALIGVCILVVFAITTVIFAVSSFASP